MHMLSNEKSVCMYMLSNQKKYFPANGQLKKDMWKSLDNGLQVCIAGDIWPRR